MSDIKEKIANLFRLAARTALHAVGSSARMSYVGRKRTVTGKGQAALL